MAKAKGGNKRRRAEAWTGADHANRTENKHRKNDLKKSGLSYRDTRTKLLTHDSKDKREASKIRLHIVKTERERECLRARLITWDDVEENKKAEEEKKKRLEEEKKKQEEHEGTQKKKKSGRLGPETWKLRGPARPAWEVYDFDTRYVDPHIKAHEEAAAKATRSRNLLAIYKGRMDENIVCRQYVSLLMQLGMLNLQAKKFKAARTAFIECMDLDGTEKPITTARCHLMRLYLEANRPESARRLFNRLPNDKSCWIRYSEALVEFVSWKLLQEKGSTREGAEKALSNAIKANVFCAFYLAYHETFESVMEYADEIEDAPEETLEEAIEYCCSEQMGSWVGTDGAIEWIRSHILNVLNGPHESLEDDNCISKSDLEWNGTLARIEKENEELQVAEEGTKVDQDNDVVAQEDDSQDEQVDVLMYARMFRTGMEMLEESGELIKGNGEVINDD